MADKTVEQKNFTLNKILVALAVVTHIDRIGGLKGLWARIWNGKKTAVIALPDDGKIPASPISTAANPTPETAQTKYK